MKTSNELEWQKWQNNNKDDYGACIIRYAERWANLMEETMTEIGSNVADIAGETSEEADTEGITGFMYGAAVAVLSSCWIYGEELKKWHNNEYGHPEATGVINPAIITIGKKEG